MSKKLRNPIVWVFEYKDLIKKNYLKELDFIKENMSVDHVCISARDGVQLENTKQCHPVIKEMTEHAHKIGLEISLHLSPYTGFFNAAFSTGNHPAIDQVQIFPIDDPKKAQGIVNDIEFTLDENGYAYQTHNAKWGRSKMMPLYSDILRAYAFEKTAEGFYIPGTLEDVTNCVRIINSRTNSMDFEVDLGADRKDKTVFVLLCQYYNCCAMTSHYERFRKMIDGYADIPLDGVTLDEFGYIVLNTNDIYSAKEPPFRGRMYDEGMREYYQDKLKTDMIRLMFDMRYAPNNDETVRIRAINRYFETLRAFPLEVERKVCDYAKKVFGDDIYIACHNTFHNKLDSDEIWKTACNWWDIPRDFGHTDEDICYPVRFGLMLATKNPINIDMYYSNNPDNHYRHMIDGAPYNTREFHHAFHDFYWGSSFTEPEFLKNIKKLDDNIALLNDFQTEYPKMDLIVIFGAAAQNNWYPNYENRNLWDIDGSLKIQDKVTEIWNNGYTNALAPDYTIEDGRITLKGDKICFGGYEFSNVLFLYPKYAKKATYEFLNNADKSGVKVAVVGESGIDFEGQPVALTAPHYDNFDMEILEKINCEKSRFKEGCVYKDGSFSLVSDSLLTGEPTKFEFILNGKKISGRHCGILAYRENKTAFASEGSELFIDNERQELEIK